MEEAIRPELTAGERELWCSEIERRCGIWFSESRMFVLARALWQRMQFRGTETYGEYHYLVTRSAAEWSALLETLLNHETCFYRHSPSFAVLSVELIPQLAATRRGTSGRHFKLWSAGCASGEEAYSLAIVADGTLAASFQHFEVLGSDLSLTALEVARKAHYGTRVADDVPEPLLGRYFRQESGGYTVNPGIRSTVRFEPFNFLDPATYPAEPQDVIFCQNVLIYFREAVRVKVAALLAECLRPGGFLVPAPGELAGLRVPGLASQRCAKAAVLRRE